MDFIFNFVTLLIGFCLGVIGTARDKNKIIEQLTDELKKLKERS